MNQLQKTSFSGGTAVNLTGAGATLASYARAAGAVPTLVAVSVRLQALAGLGSTVTLTLTRTDEDAVAGTFAKKQIVVTTAASTLRVDLPPVLLKANETLAVSAASTAAGDSAVAGAVWFADAVLDASAIVSGGAVTTVDGQVSVNGLSADRINALDNLNAPITSRLAGDAYTLPATPSDVAAAAATVIVAGDARWTTATGFATPADLAGLVTSETFSAGIVVLSEQIEAIPAPDVPTVAEIRQEIDSNSVQLADLASAVAETARPGDAMGLTESAVDAVAAAGSSTTINWTIEDGA